MYAPKSAARSRAFTGGKIPGWLVSLALPVTLLLGWWCYGEITGGSIYYPSLSSIFAAFGEEWIGPRLVTDVLPTLASILLGFGLSTIVGILLGVALGLSPVLSRALHPLLEFFRSMPLVAGVPLVIAIVGVGWEMKMLIVLFASLWPVLLNTAEGVASIDPVAKSTARSYQVRGATYFFRVLIPAASPQILAGTRIALALSIVMIIISEMIVSARGIGNVISTATGSFDLPTLWSTIILLALIALLLNGAFQLVERRFLRWHRIQRRTEAS